LTLFLKAFGVDRDDDDVGPWLEVREPDRKVVDGFVEPVGRAGAYEREKQNRGKNSGGAPFNPKASAISRERTFR